MVSALAYLEANQLYHGDIRPSRIYLDQEGEVHLADHNLIPDMLTGY